jgi:hypothetical protein
VLPDGDRAARVAGAAAIGLIAIGLLFSHEAAGHSWPSSGAALLPTVRHCLVFSLVALLVPFGIALGFARRLMPVGASRMGAALGASAGALLGFVLHLLCPYASALHVAIGHGGGVVGGALLGALIAPRVVRS